VNVPTALHSRVATGGTDEWITPPEVFDPLQAVYGFRVDLAARAAEIARCAVFLSNALTARWGRFRGPGWVNPPYSLAGAFLRKASREMEAGFTTVALVNVATDTHAWDKYVLSDERVYIRVIPGRVWYIAGVDIYKRHPSGARVLSLRAGERGPSPHPSAVLVFPGDRHVPPPPGGGGRFGVYRVDHYRPGAARRAEILADERVGAEEETLP
jgi:phage N-6-adenine-methyltransferase